MPRGGDRPVLARSHGRAVSGGLRAFRGHRAGDSLNRRNRLSGRHQAIGGRIVRPKISNRAVAVGDGVAVDAAMRAGVVGADVARQGAAAARPIAALARRDWPLGDIRQPLGIDAARLSEPRNQQFRLAAQGRGDALISGDRCEPRQQPLLFVEAWIVPDETVPAGRAVEGAAGYFIWGFVPETGPL